VPFGDSCPLPARDYLLFHLILFLATFLRELINKADLAGENTKITVYPLQALLKIKTCDQVTFQMQILPESHKISHHLIKLGKHKQKD
jgi:hypothetical protein